MKTAVKTTLIFIAAILSFPVANAQQVGKQIPPEITNGVQIETHSTLYNQAYLEMADMLDGKTSLSIKRAVFLQEWAYLDGNLDYDEYCTGIDTVATFLRNFITANGLDQYKTAGNYALFEYFSRPYSGNGHKPFTYDYEDFGGTDDFTKLFVTKAMRTHSGQCRSLPVYYKILAEAIGAEAYIAFAPQHLFIRHRDEMEPNKWVNVELTTQSLSREISYIENFGITDAAIRNKVYLNPLTDKETIAYLLSELATGYLRKYENYDDFTWLCANKSIEHYPQNITALHQKGNIINIRLMEYLAYNGRVYDDYARLLDDKWKENFELVKELGWTEMSDEVYEKLLQDTENAMRTDGMDETKINSEIEKAR
ncbi:uncharacterized protein BN783_01030 [Odoribacter sp. CAG:788]|jgi:hypothetical protein|nr:uncharacterized protein BN783_01030 [Odoribacter sp. CAG:788]